MAMNMKKTMTIAGLATASTLSAAVTAFTVSAPFTGRPTRLSPSSLFASSDTGANNYYYMTPKNGAETPGSDVSILPELERPTVETGDTQQTKKKAPKSKRPAPKNPAHKDGLLSPIVSVVGGILGEEGLKEVRGKAISIHSDIIKGFVDTSESAFGQATLKRMFQLADKDGSGTVDREELESALQSLGFTWLQEKQAGGILKRADDNDDGQIDLEEFLKEAPRTLRTNLVKLAKKNGGDMGLLSSPKKKDAQSGKKSAHKEGILSPVVGVARSVMGDETLKEVRGKVISIHSDVIKGFVETSDSEFGQSTLKKMFEMADKDGSGTVSREELEVALQSLGFTWLQEKQSSGILKRADDNDDGQIDLEEFLKEAPKTLRTNLVKLAKKNGGDMGLLS